MLAFDWAPGSGPLSRVTAKLGAANRVQVALTARDAGLA
jgi:DNA-binding NarL/FixJ family response regulator